MEIEKDYLPLCGEISEPKASRVGGGGSVSSGPHPKFAPPHQLRSHEFRPPHGGGGHADDIVAIARQWIGTPYVYQASLKGVGCDCLGLLRGIWRELRGDEPEDIPPYSPDWAEATGAETLYMALARHAREVPAAQIAPGDVALFRMKTSSPAKHCGIVARNESTSPLVWRSEREALRVGGDPLTLIHARQNKRVSEEPLSSYWRSKLAFAFRL